MRPVKVKKVHNTPRNLQSRCLHIMYMWESSFHSIKHDTFDSPNVSVQCLCYLLVCHIMGFHGSVYSSLSVFGMYHLNWRASYDICFVTSATFFLICDWVMLLALWGQCYRSWILDWDISLLESYALPSTVHLRKKKLNLNQGLPSSHS